MRKYRQKHSDRELAAYKVLVLAKIESAIDTLKSITEEHERQEVECNESGSLYSYDNCIGKAYSDSIKKLDRMKENWSWDGW